MADAPPARPVSAFSPEPGDVSKENAAESTFRRQWSDGMAEGKPEERHDQQSLAAMEQALRVFRTKDSIMDVTVLDVLKRFMSAGGQPHVVVKLLAENYRGFAQMCNLAYEWLRAAGISEEEATEVAFAHIRSLIVERFDARKVDQIFEEESPSAAWLEAMIANGNWRKLIYQLSEQEKGCVLLQYTIQRISDAGHQDEIASLTTASAYFTVFNRVLREYLTKLLDTEEEHLGQLLPDLKKICGQSEHTYLYLQLVLHRLQAAHPNAEGLRRLAEELEQALRDVSPLVRKIGFQISDIRRYPDLALTVSNILTSGESNPGDVVTLDNLYSQPDPPPLRLLRHPELIDILVRDVFHPSKPPIDPQLLPRYTHLLAVISAARDRREDSGGLDLEHVARAQRIVSDAHSTCRNNPIGLELQASLGEIREAVSHPMASVGILTMVGANLLDKGYYSTTYATTSTPIYFGLLRLISQKHATQHRHVLDLVVRCFDMPHDLDALALLELRKSLLDVLIFLMGCGCVLPVLAQVDRWAQAVDQALIRFFIHQVLDMIDGPYSLDFLAAFLRLMPRAITSDAMRSAADTRDSVRSFLTHCQTANYPLAPADLALVSELLGILKT